ncbi:MAG: hypothetical protein IJU98_10740 [Synergistaceae bacterium]|nr:hypothetical protein [Synergistaceae bacterium]
MYGGVITKRQKKLKTKSRIPFVRKGVLPSATRAAMSDAENDRTEAVSLDDLKTQMDAIY